MYNITIATGNDERLFDMVKPFLDDEYRIEEVDLHWWVEGIDDEHCEVQVKHSGSPTSPAGGCIVELATEQAVELYKKFDEIVEMPKLAEDLRMTIKLFDVVQIQYNGLVTLRPK